MEKEYNVKLSEKQIIYLLETLENLCCHSSSKNLIELRDELRKYVNK